MRWSSPRNRTCPNQQVDLAFAIDDVFERHGIDAALDAFCDIEQNEDLCH